MKLFGLELGKKRKKTKDDTKTSNKNLDIEVAKVEDTSLDNNVEIKKEITPTENSKKKKQSKKEKKKKTKKPNESLILKILTPVLIVFIILLMKDRFFGVPSPKVKDIPKVITTPQMKPKTTMKVVYDKNDRILKWNLSEKFVGPDFIAEISNKPVYLWLELSDKGTILYQDILLSERSPEETNKLLKFLPRLKVQYTESNKPKEVMFLVKLTHNNAKINYNFKFLNNIKQAINYLNGKPLDYNSSDNRELSSVKPIISGKITGIMVGKRSSILLEGGKVIRVGDHVRSGIVLEIRDRYVIVKNRDKTYKFFVGQKI